VRLEESQVRSNLRSTDKLLDIIQVIEAAEEGDKLAFQLLTEAGDEFGQALAIVLNLFGPRLVVVGGAMSHSAIFLDAARRMVRLRALEQAARVAVIEPSRLDPSAGARGAATMVLNALFESKDQNLIRLLANHRP
jgi:N-acetylglucosamine repressor